MIINRLMGKGKDFKRKAEKLIELCENVKAGTTAKIKKPCLQLFFFFSY